MEDFLDKELNDLAKNHLKRDLRLVEGIQNARMQIDGREVLNFCSNNYLGLAGDSRLAQAALECLQKEGLGTGASRLISGNMKAHQRLEEKIAQFKGTESALTFTSGYMANIGIISSLFDREDCIFSDKLNHASIVDGILLSRAKLVRYPHNDMDALRKMLNKETGHKKRCIITDSVFSMDGDIAPLDKIVELAKEYNCVVMIDEAHALGVMGDKGKGLAEYFGVEKDIDIHMGTFSKAVGSFGAYACGSKKLISYLINKAHSFIYTTALPPSIAAASLKGIEIIEREHFLRDQLGENVRYMRAQFKLLGFDTIVSQTPIIPLIVKDSALALEFSKRLMDKGIFVSAIRPPTVPLNSSRLRVTVTSSHKKDEIDYALRQFEKIGKELCLI